VKNEKPGLTAYFVVQIALLPLLFVIEFLLLWFFSRTKVRKGIGILSILIIQILFSQGFVELSLCIFPNTEREYTEVIFQEIYFLNSLVILFSESRVLKGILMFYIAILSLFRFSNFAESVLYISWCLIAIIIIFSTLIIFRKRKIFKPPPEPSHHKHNFKIETEVEGVAIIAKDKSVLAMNGLFRGMLDEDSENLALEKLLNLRKFESYPAEFQKALLNEIKLTKLQLPKNFKESRSFGDIPKSTTALIKSLEVPTSRAGKTINPQQRPSFFQRPSIFQRGSLFQRPSIFQRTSIMANRKISHHVSAASSNKIDTQTQLTTGRGPLIKINFSKADEEQTESIRPGQGVGDESDTRSPLIKATPGQGFGIILKNKVLTFLRRRLLFISDF